MDKDLMGVEGVITDNLGNRFSLDSSALSFSWNTDGTLAYIEAVNDTGTRRQTYTYAGGKLTGISRWVLQ